MLCRLHDCCYNNNGICEDRILHDPEKHQKEKEVYFHMFDKCVRESQNTVNVRWFDGYLETFKASEVRFGSDLLFIRLIDGMNRHIPLRMVRWFSLTKESHEIQE